MIADAAPKQTFEGDVGVVFLLWHNAKQGLSRSGGGGREEDDDDDEEEEEEDEEEEEQQQQQQ